MTRVIIDGDKIEIKIDESNVFELTWPILDKLELAIKAIRDINAVTSYKGLDMTF